MRRAVVALGGLLVASSLTTTASVALAARPAAAIASVVPFRSADALVRQQFRDFQGRSATTSEVSPYVSALTGGSATAAATVDAVAHLDTPAERSANVTRLYTAYFQRLPDFSGLQYWINKSASGWTLNKISGNFAASSEFKRKYGSLSNAAFVDRAFQNVFERPADPSGRTYWINKLNKGMARGAVMVGFSQSSEYQRKQAPTVEMVLAYSGLLRRIPTGTEASGAVARVQAAGFAALAGDLMALPAYPARFPAPGRPTSTELYPDDGKVAVEWTAPATNGVALAGFALTVLQAGVPQGPVRTLPPTATSTEVTGLVNGESYSFSLLAFNAARDGAAATIGPVTVAPNIQWSTFQGGPAHTGVQPYGTVPANPQLLWQTHLPNQARQVIYGDERVFVVTMGSGGSVPHGGADVYALDPDDGSILWGPVDLGGGSLDDPDLGYANRRVFFSNESGRLVALDSETGATEWSVQFEGLSQPDGVTVYGGVLYLLEYRKGLTAVDASTGAIRWEAPTMNNSGTSAVDASGIYVAQGCRYAYRFTFAGEVSWSTGGSCTGGGAGVPTLGSGRMWTSGLSQADERVYDQASGARLGSIAGGQAPALLGSTVLVNRFGTLEARDAATRSLLWSAAEDDTFTGPPVVNAGRVYTGGEHGHLRSFDTATGAGVWVHDVFADLSPAPKYGSAALVGDLAIGDGVLLVPVSSVTVPTAGGWVAAYGTAPGGDEG